MYNPIPHLPHKFQKVISLLKAKKIPSRLIFFITGLFATAWFLIRVIPKPSRAAYPCMQATAPFMSGFVLYLLSFGGGIFALKRLRTSLMASKFALAFAFLLIAIVLYVVSTTQMPVKLFAGNAVAVKGNFPPNAPIGVAGGIFPGRVVWMWDPHATNENCSNTSNNNGSIDAGDDAWFMAANNDESVIDSMVIKSLNALTGATDNSQAWDKLFKFYNINHGNGNTGYSTGQKILVKINETSAYGGLAGGKFFAGLSRTDDQAVNLFSSETDPYLVLSVLRQLVDYAQVPEDMIYVGDPARNIYKEFYDLWHGEFPGVHVLGNNLIHTELDVAALGRLPVAVSSGDKVFFSDHGMVMPDAVSDKLFTIFDDISYLINIPALKAHATAGITLAAKNHFGSFTREWAVQLHPGLMANNDDPVRLGYGLYRVQTDIMMHKLLSGKNLLIIVDGLYPGEDAVVLPDKWQSIPFNNDWCSSIFMSLDPVAIESVCHDFLRTEYNGPTIAESRPNWSGVDDYLHQAADSSLWPQGIIYDPDNDGILIASLGVHEHWNDSLRKQYTRNLGSGNGIELFKVHDYYIVIDEQPNPLAVNVYPNPAKDYVRISNPGNYALAYSLADLNGKIFLNGEIGKHLVKQIDITRFADGVYMISFYNAGKVQSVKIVKSNL